MNDRNLNDDMVKLARYSIVNTQRDAEEVLASNQEILVKDAMTEEAFSSWVIAMNDDTKKMEPDDRKYLRVSYEVVGRWPKQDRNYDKLKLDALDGINVKLDALNGIKVAIEKKK